MMKRTLGMIGAAAVLAACGTTPSGTHAPADGSHVAASAWTLLGDTPAPRSGHAAVYDAARDRLLVFGGGANDLWAERLSGPDAGAWERLDAGGDVPPPIGVVAVIDEGSNRLVVFPADSLDRARRRGASTR